MVNKRGYTLKMWREKYGAFIAAFVCLYCLVINWGNNEFLAGFFGLGVIICSAIGIIEVNKDSNSEE